MTEIHITSVNGDLMAEVNGEKCYELYECIHDMGWGFGENHEIDFDLTENDDVWALIDAIYEQNEEE